MINNGNSIKFKDVMKSALPYLRASAFALIVLLTALGVGGATIFGSLIGFLFKKASHRFSIFSL